MLFVCTGICVLSPEHESEKRGYLVYVLIVKKLSHRFCLNSATVCQIGRSYRGIFLKRFQRGLQTISSIEIIGKERKHLALRQQKPLRLIRDGEVWGVRNFISYTYLLHCQHQNEGSCVCPFNVSLIMWAKSQDSVHKPQFLKKKESRSGLYQGPSAYQPSAIPLGHTGSQYSMSMPVRLYKPKGSQGPLWLLFDFKSTVKCPI